MKIIKKILRPIKGFFVIHQNNKYLKKSINLTHKEKHIVFICQCEYIWNKTRNVFIELKKRKIKTSLYIIKDNLSINPTDITIFEKEFAADCFHYEATKLEELQPSLVIYTRPYEEYLPYDIRAHSVQRYSRIAYIPYYFSLEKEYGLNNDMFRKTNLYFADCKDNYDYFINYCQKNVRRGIQQAYNLGYPVFENLLDFKGVNIYKNENRKKVMWTPRWTTDLKLGGSNFLKYKDQMFELFIDNQEYSFVFRPHPMLFSNFINKGIISEDEKNKIINRINKSDNSVYDVRSEYIDTFKNTDILITDNSAIVVEYFLTGKPMIYCYNKSNLIFSETMNTILNCNYVAHSFEDIVEYLKINDYKKELREQEVKKFIENNMGASTRIVDVIEKY